MVRSVAVLVVAAAFAVTSCGGGAAGGGTDRRVAIPAALAADVPLPEGARLRSVRDFGSKGLTLVFETDEPVAAVDRRLRARLEAKGWTLLSDVVVEGAVFSSYRSRARSVALGISRTGGVTVVGLAYHQPEPEREGVQG
jgi:hypothetical protein